MPRCAYQQTTLAYACFKNNAVGLDGVLVVGVPQHQNRVKAIELWHIRHHGPGEVKMLQLDQELSWDLRGQVLLRYIRTAAEEPVLAERKTLLFAIGQQQHLPAPF